MLANSYSLITVILVASSIFGLLVFTNLRNFHFILLTDKAIKELKERMLRPRCQTNLRKVEDTTILTGVVKNFLMNLNDPILTSALSDEFKEYAEKGSTNHLYGTISKLPHENRHTLAFLIIHLQK